MKVLIYTLIFLIFPVTLHAQLKVEIEGPTESLGGELVILRARVTQDVESKKLIILWVSTLENYLPVNNNTQVVFATRKPGRYNFSLLVVSITQDIETNQVVTESARSTHTVIIRSDDVLPEPDLPKPVTHPLTKWVKNQIYQVPSEALKELDSVARAFNLAADEIEKNNLTTPEEISVATKNYTSVAVEDRYQTMWRDSFFIPLGNELSRMKPKGTKEHVEAWRAIAKGLTKGK